MFTNIPFSIASKQNQRFPIAFFGYEKVKMGIVTKSSQGRYLDCPIQRPQKTPIQVLNNTLRPHHSIAVKYRIRFVLVIALSAMVTSYFQRADGPEK
jgi:hypothetical protein